MNEDTICKHLFILRHGHAATEGQTDFARSLNEKGRKWLEKTATFIRNKAAELDLPIQLCISSASLRTQQTTEIIRQYCPIQTIEYKQELYVASVSQWLSMISQVLEQNIILVGHNPTFSQMLNYFCGVQAYMKPANCALVKLEINPDGIIYPATLIEFHENR